MLIPLSLVCARLWHPKAELKRVTEERDILRRRHIFCEVIQVRGAFIQEHASQDSVAIQFVDLIE